MAPKPYELIGKMAIHGPKTFFVALIGTSPSLSASQVARKITEHQSGERALTGSDGKQGTITGGCAR